MTAYNQPYGTTANSPYVNGNPATGEEGSIPPAAAIENPQRELVNFISDSGLTPDNAKLRQVGQSVQAGKVRYGVDVGTANSLAVTLTPAPEAYTTGMVIEVLKGASANTVTNPGINVNGLGGRTIVRRNGSALAISDLVGSTWYPLGYDGTNFRVLTTVASDIGTSLGALKALFNVNALTYATRTSLTGPGDGVTWRTVTSGTLTKVSPTSKLVFWMTMPIWGGPSGGSTGTATKLRVVIGGLTTYGVTAYGTTGSVSGQTALNNVLSGLGAGSQAYSIALSRPNDGIPWEAYVNPTSADSQFFEAAGTVTTIIVGEIEP